MDYRWFGGRFVSQKTEHAGAKNSMAKSGFWGLRADAKAESRSLRRHMDRREEQAGIEYGFNVWRDDREIERLTDWMDVADFTVSEEEGLVYFQVEWQSG